MTEKLFVIYFNDLSMNSSGWHGRKGDLFMYHYVEDKEFLKEMKSLCSKIINQLVQSINNDSVMTVKAELVGSGAKNLITQNGKEAIDLDYNLCIEEVFELNFNYSMRIKEYIKKHFNTVLNNNGWGDCQDSTSVITTEKRYFTNGNKTPFSIDLAIVRKINGNWERLIHDKTGFVNLDRWYWNIAPNSRGLSDKVYEIKKENLWNEVRDLYLAKKNIYLRRQDYNHPSFIIYLETINEIYDKHFTNQLVSYY